MTEWGEEQQLLSCLGRSDTSTQHREWEVVTQSASVLHFNVLPPVPVWAGLANRAMRVKERREVERREDPPAAKGTRRRHRTSRRKKYYLKESQEVPVIIVSQEEKEGKVIIQTSC